VLGVVRHLSGRVNRAGCCRLASAALLAALLVALILTPAQALGSATTPTRGPLSKRPTIKHHKGPPPKKLTIKNIINGTGPGAANGDALITNYVGALYSNTKVFGSSWSLGGPFALTLGSGEVIEGWERGLLGMRVGGRRELIVPPGLAYGKRGNPPRIPPNSTLVFVVDLLAA
jgi:peptidylprolyl isomerase